MLKKTLTGSDILEMIKKQLAADGLVFKDIIDDDGFNFSNLTQIEIEVGIKRDIAVPITYPPGARSASNADRVTAEFPHILKDIPEDDPLRKKMLRIEERNSNIAYKRRGPSNLRSTFAADRDGASVLEDVKVGLTS